MKILKFSNGKKNMLYKNLLSVLVAFILVTMSISTLAAPETIWAGDAGNASDLIIITKPPKDKATTFEDTYIVSGNGQPGVKVTMYYMQNGAYKPLVNGGNRVQWQISANGLFFKKIDLNKGKNVLLCHAERSDGKYQIVKFDINSMSPQVSASIQNMIVTLPGLK